MHIAILWIRAAPTLYHCIKLYMVPAEMFSPHLYGGVYDQGMEET